MSALARYAAALYYLGPRQAYRNLVHRATRPTRRFRRYSRTVLGLEWAGHAQTAFLTHASGTRLENGRFTALGRSRELGDPPDWDCQAPLLWLFNLHDFAWLAALAPAAQRRLVLDWIDRYPASARRPGWMNYPLALRLRHWIAMLFADGGWSATERTRLLASIEAQAACLGDTLEYHLRGNHLLEGAITLKLVSACLRGAGAERWQRRADRVLEEELREQFLLDGGHIERSPMYQLRLVHGLLDLINVLPERDETRVRLEQRLPAILRFVSSMRHPDGEIALFNDAALDVAPGPGAILEYAGRLGLDAPDFAAGSFPETGYHVWREGGDALFVDTGPLGPDYLTGHGHGDIFSFELSLDGKRVVVDGGTSSYEAGAERAWIRSTAAHNTVEIAGQDQAEFFGAFRVGRRGRPRDVEARVSADGLHVSGWHDGYHRLSGRPVHHRELVLLARAALLVWDTVESSRSLPAVGRLRFPPGATVRLDGADRAAIEVAGTPLALHAFGATLSVEDGFYAPRFGERLACPVLALRASAPAEFGYALARAATPVRIEAGGAEVSGRVVARRSRRPAHREGDA
jgi:uncharacterized heparinase superfamily protein